MAIRHKPHNSKKGVSPVLAHIISEIDSIARSLDNPFPADREREFLVVIDFNNYYEHYAFVNKNLTDRFLINANNKIDPNKYVDLVCVYNISSNSLYLQEGKEPGVSYIIALFDLKQIVDRPVTLSCKSLFEFFTKSLH